MKIDNEQSGINLAFIDTYEYDAFGNETLENEKSEYNPFRYNGQYYDEETGFIYLRNRYYDPSIGRFTQEDPVKDGFNWYVYCGNNPVNRVDPLGLFDYDTVLSYNPGQKNNDVIALQNELAYLGYLNPNDVDGYFGQKTLDAVNAYKYDNGLWNDGEYYGKVGLTTWQNLGLIYRTQGDIDRGVTIFTEASGRQLYDVTKMFNDQLWYAEQYLNSLSIWNSMVEWYNKVDHRGDWDIKIRESWDRTFGGSYPGSYDSEVILYGEYSTPEKMGNIMYGYTGKVVGWGDAILYAGSFGAAVPANWGDVSAELSDWPSINRGIQLYNDKHMNVPVLIL